MNIFLMLLALALSIASLVSVILWPVMIVRAAINDSLSKPKKALWILGQVFLIFPATYLYMVIVEKNRKLHNTGIVFIAIVVISLIIPHTRNIIFGAFQNHPNGVSTPPELHG
ncbi:MAG: hypothetical protein P4M15_05885 [Alphaproteobacteria bacterium]|nr:hypothetical protein [Alphaproteobacteria bacterium]